MKLNDRFIKSGIATSEATDVRMPWTRGRDRQEQSAERQQQTHDVHRTG